jgi:hypothetical protein
MISSISIHRHLRIKICFFSGKSGTLLIELTYLLARSLFLDMAEVETSVPDQQQLKQTQGRH